LATFTSSLSGFRLDEKIDQEKAWKKSSKSDRHVCAELHFKGKSRRWHGFHDGVQGKRRGNNGRYWQCTCGDLRNLSHCLQKKGKPKQRLRNDAGKHSLLPQTTKTGTNQRLKPTLRHVIWRKGHGRGQQGEKGDNLEVLHGDARFYQSTKGRM
jgi:hypothetical protein